MHGIFLSAVVSHIFNFNAAIRPLGPYRIASHLRNNGYDIQVIEFAQYLENDRLEKLLEKFITKDTKFIGLGLMIWYENQKFVQIMNKFADLFTTIKKNYPNIKIIVGGSTSFMWSKRYPNNSVIDYIVKGYGEDQTLSLFDYHYKNSNHPPFELIDGNKHLSENMVIDKQFNFLRNSHTWSKSDCIQPGEALPIEFARGCIFKCSFCKYPHIGKSKNDYTKELDCIKQELLDNYYKFGTTSYYVTDDTFNADKDFIEAFSIMSKSLPFKLQYGAYLRADLLDAHPDQEDMFLENGLNSCFFGIETFDPNNAKIIGKPWSAKRAKEYVPYVYNEKWKSKISITSSFIAGLPNETLESLKEVNQWIVDNNLPSIVWHPLQITRDSNSYKSEFELNAEKYGIHFKLFEGKSIWYHDTCDEKLAIEWTKELVNDIKPNIGPQCWGNIEYLTYGYNKNFNVDTRQLKHHEIDWTWMSQSVKSIVTNYYKDLMSL
jgi:radical SAM superfamily enzyme YgiQ (UPF0313 family)